MTDIKRVIDEIKEKIGARYEDNEAYLKLPYFLYRADASIGLKIFSEGDSLYISDMGTAYDYLDCMGVDASSHKKRIDAIKKKFNIVENELHEMIMEFPSENRVSIQMFISFFIGAISAIAYSYIGD